MGSRCEPGTPKYLLGARTVNAPIPAAHQDAARAQGRERFQQFVDQLARHLQKGRSLVGRVHEEIFPDQSRFFGVDGEEEEAEASGTSLTEADADGQGARP